MSLFNFALHGTLGDQSSNKGIASAFSILNGDALSYLVNGTAYDSGTNPPNVEGAVTTFVEDIEADNEIRIRITSIQETHIRYIPNVIRMTFGAGALASKLTSQLISLGFRNGDCDPRYIGIREIISKEKGLSSVDQTVVYSDWIPCKLYYQSPITNSAVTGQTNHLGTANRSIGYLGYNRNRGTTKYIYDAGNNPNGTGPDSVVLALVPNKALNNNSEYEIYLNTNMPFIRLEPETGSNPELPSGGGGGTIVTGGAD